jgi:hypothetical protein
VDVVDLYRLGSTATKTEPAKNLAASVSFLLLLLFFFNNQLPSSSHIVVAAG